MSLHYWSAGCKLASFLLRGKKNLRSEKELGKEQPAATNPVLTILRSECLLWEIEQLLRGEDLFHLTLILHINSAGHLSKHQQREEKHKRRSKQTDEFAAGIFHTKTDLGA